jgi:mRNA-degrading endonuclease RelE of RelBE toxin-antitoxin system
VTYRIRWSSPARRSIEQYLPESVASVVWEFVYGALAESPRRVGKPLRGDLAGFWSARRGQYRVVYVVDGDSETVTVAAVDHRRDVYPR